MTYEDVFIHPSTIIGARVEIEPGARIGVRGLALERHGKNMKQFHMKEYKGCVVLKDDVHIGSNTCVERGLTTKTIIGKGSKIDLLCCIGHDVRIGRNVRITPMCNILGYVTIADNVFIGAGSNIRPRIRIGAKAYVGMGSNIVCDVPAGEKWYGNPARNSECRLRKPTDRRH